jgi:hypothetical protein
MEPQPTTKETKPEDQQRVAQDRSDHAGLNQPNLSLNERQDGDQEFDGVSKGGVEETSEGVSHSKSELFGGE